MAVIDTLKLELNISGDSEDDLLNAYLEQSKQAILRRLYPFDPTVTEMPAIYEHNQVEIAVYLYNRRGTEGELSRSESGVHATYESPSIPISMFRGIIPFAGIPR